MKRTMTFDGRVRAGVRVCCRVPFDRVTGLVPDGLEPVRRGGFGFVEVVSGRVEKLRPKVLPGIVNLPGPLPGGVGFNQVAYRVHVQAMTDGAEVVRGLYTLRTECDATLLGRLANRLTDLRYHDAAVVIEEDDCHVAIATTPGKHGRDAGVGLDLAVTHMPAALLPGSCFPTVEDARAFYGYQPALLGVARVAQGGRALTRAVALRVGRPCCESPVGIVRARWGYFEMLGLADLMEPEWAVRVSPVATRWELGMREGLLGGGRREGSARGKALARDVARHPLNDGWEVDQPQEVTALPPRPAASGRR